MHRAVAVLALSAFVACVSNDDVTNPTSTDIAGSYSLRAINGAALPYVLGISTSLTDTLTLVDDTYTLSADSRFSEIFHTRQVKSGTTQIVTGSDSGSFTRSGQTLRMVGVNGVFSATIKTDTLQLDGESTTFIYKR
jgi:hypothetical protein